MDRLERLRAEIDVEGARGLEIGPLFRPTVTPEMGKVWYADHASTEELRAKYRTDPQVDVDAIAPVDFVVAEVPLRVAAAAEAPFDYVVASHVVEHVPDIAGWLADVHSVMAPGSRLSLAVPDRRFSFDVRRRPSDIAEVVEAALLHLRRPAVRVTFDHFYRHVDVDPVALWRTDVSYAERPYHADQALVQATTAATTDAYLDSHCWVFSDLEFLELYREMAQLGLVEMAVHSATPTQLDEHEFFVVLERLPDGLAPDEVKARVLASIPRLEQVVRPVDVPPAPAPPPEDGGRDYRLSEREIAAVELKRRAATALRRALRR